MSIRERSNLPLPRCDSRASAHASRARHPRLSLGVSTVAVVTEPELPDWLSKGSGFELLDGSDEGWWRIKSEGAAAHLGSVPDNVRLDLQIASNTTLSADAVGDGAILRLSIPGGVTVNVSARFDHIQLVSRTSASDDVVKRLFLHNSAELDLGEGAWQIDAPHGGKGITLEVVCTSADVIVSGRAGLASVKASGAVTISSPLAPGGRVKVTNGELKVRSELNDVKVTCGDVTFSKAVRGSNVVSTGRVTATDGLYDSTVDAEAQISVGGNVIGCDLTTRANDGFALTVGSKSPLDASLKELEISLKEMDQTLLSLPVGDVVTSSVNAPAGGDVLVGRLIELKSLIAAGNVWATDLAAAEKSSEKVTVGRTVLVRVNCDLGGRDLRVQSLRVLGNLSGKGSSVSAEESVFVGGECVGLTRIAAAEAVFEAAVELDDLIVRNLELAGRLNVRNIDLTGPVYPNDSEAQPDRSDWRSESIKAVRALRGEAGPLVAARQSQEVSNLVLGEGSGVGVLKLSGTVRLAGQGSDQILIGHVEFAQNSSEISLAGGSWVVDRLTISRGDACVVLPDGTSLRATLDGNNLGKALVVSGAGAIELTGKKHPINLASLDVKGSCETTIDLVVDRLKALAKGDAVASLNVLSKGVVRELSGEIRLGSIEGRIESRDSPAAKVVSIAEQDEDSRGQVAGVDPSDIPFHELRNIERLSVFEPSAKAVRRSASHTRNSFEARERSQWAIELERVVRGRAVSGEARAAVRWAAARIQHQALARGSPERFGRALHRLVGYGYKPMAPILLWIASSVVVALFSLATVPALGWGLCSKWADGKVCSDELADYSAEIFRSMFFPFRLLRVTADAEVFTFLPDWATPLAGIAVGLPFIFVLIAIRNYFRPRWEDR